MAKSSTKRAHALHKSSRDARKQLRTVADMVRWCASSFNDAKLVFAHGFDNAVDEALALVLHTLHLDPGLPSELFAARVCRSERARITARVEERIQTRKPLAYVIGEAWFAGHRFTCDERALVPRSPLAEWIEKRFEPFLEPSKVNAIVDVGTGSGCIAIACAHAFPNARVDAVDISEDALALAALNVSAHGLANRVQLLGGDLLAACQGPYELIIANPPYVPRASFDSLPPEFMHEPALGLEAGDTGLDYVQQILVQAVERLSDDGILVMEVGEAEEALAIAYPQLPFVWLEFERGGGGVVLIDRLRLANGLKGMI